MVTLKSSYWNECLNAKRECDFAEQAEERLAQEAVEQL